MSEVVEILGNNRFSTIENPKLRAHSFITNCKVSFLHSKPISNSIELPKGTLLDDSSLKIIFVEYPSSLPYYEFCEQLFQSIKNLSDDCTNHKNITALLPRFSNFQEYSAVNELKLSLQQIGINSHHHPILKPELIQSYTESDCIFQRFKIIHNEFLNAMILNI